jgi:hypothetical protein
MTPTAAAQLTGGAGADKPNSGVTSALPITAKARVVL